MSCIMIVEPSALVRRSWKLASAYLKLPLQHTEVVLPPAGCPVTQPQCDRNCISSLQVCWYERVMPQSKAHAIGDHVWINFKIWIKPESAGTATHRLIMKLRCAKMRWGNTLGFQPCVSRRDLSCTIKMCK